MQAGPPFDEVFVLFVSFVVNLTGVPLSAKQDYLAQSLVEAAEQKLAG
jgi:hypothetical protein